MKLRERWYSPRVQSDVTVVRWGHFGRPVIVFPTAGGDAEEIERMRVIDSLGDLSDAGRIKVYSCDSIAGYAMVRGDGSPRYRAALLFATPLHFLPGLNGGILDQLRSRFAILASGEGRWEDIGHSWKLAGVMGEKGIPNRVDPWGTDYDHDWPTWRRMLPHYLNELS